MKNFREITPFDIATNVFDDIDRRWLLISCVDADQGRTNLMTASWGAMGILWNKPVCILFIRPQRHTHKLMGENDRLGVSIFGENYREQLKICGSKSGRDIDKPTVCGFTPFVENGAVGYEEAETVLCLKKLYQDELKEGCFLDPTIVKKCYPGSDFHTFYVCEIEKVYTKRK